MNLEEEVVPSVVRPRNVSLKPLTMMLQHISVQGADEAAVCDVITNSFVGGSILSKGVNDDTRDD